eukprot:CAMPEP_0115158200 /NCGR_PEP_ID=MMETSP0227-20121206/69448_1 /TAXON_ID=89957 /ORGANISM="Polarella glacialis, Strain CCMP 1383" /LENGTH=382 /DNA_ID=CAMNT_0002569621 /DNA_START=40 /DNA_END=1188 /DNA_ORIENTATION=-
MPKTTETSLYLKARGSVLFGRPSAFLKGAATEAKKNEGSCFDACFGMLLGHPGVTGKGGPESATRYGEKKTLGNLPPARNFADLPQGKRGGMTVEICSTGKETVEGWINQDAAMACQPSGCSGGDGQGPLYLLGVFDGHGKYGHEVSDIATNRLPGHISSQEVHPSTDPKKALQDAFQNMDDDIFAKMGSQVEYSGSTGVVVLLDHGKRLLTTANVGDSRAVIGQKSADARSPRWSAVALTADLKPELPEERERIELTGGTVAQFKDDRTGEECGPFRVWDGPGLEKPGLAVSRSLGDGAARDLGVIAEPVVTSHKLRPEDQFLLIATDGLWDSVSNEEAVRIVAKFIHMPKVALKALTETVRRIEGNELVDDTTMLLVVFN